MQFSLPLGEKDKKIPRREQKGVVEKTHEIGRLCMIARAMDPKDVEPEFLREVSRVFRNPGLDRLQ